MNKFKMKPEYSEYFKQIKIKEFATRIGITRQTLSNIVNGHSICGYPVAFTIAKHINMNVEVNEVFKEI